MSVRELSIDVLGLSNRSVNALHRSEVHTVEDLSKCTEEQLQRFRNLGTKSINEIVPVIASCRLLIRLEEEGAVSEAAPGVAAPDASNRQPMSDVDRETVYQYVCAHDLDLQVLGLPARAEHCLRREGYNRLSEVIFLTENELGRIHSLGRTSIEGFMDAVRRYFEAHEEEIRAFSEGGRDALYTDDDIKKQILDLYRSHSFAGLNVTDIKTAVPAGSEISEERLKRIIGKLIAEHQLEYVDYRCYRVFPHFIEYLEACRGRKGIKDHYLDYLKKRLQGETLEAIAKEGGLTRERVRQIVNKAKEKVKNAYVLEFDSGCFDEDYYAYFYQTYAFNRKDAAEWLGIPVETWRYLEFFYEAGQRDYMEAPEDPKIDPGLKVKIKNYMNRDKLLLDGVWVERKRAELEEYVAGKYCTDGVTYEEFVQIYNRFLEEEEIPFDPDVYITDAVRMTRRNFLADCRFILWKQFETLRYYEIDAQDYTELLDALNLEAYENTGLSTMKWIESYPEVMARYDIRDQYELHNLLRKIIPAENTYNLTFGKMPHVFFGEFDRSKALLELMKENAPISQPDLVRLIHEEYGFEPGTIQGSYLPEFNVYLHQGVYSVGCTELPKEHEEILAGLLTDDFYYFDEIRKIFTAAVPDADPDEINPFNLKRMGFQVFTRYALQNYASLEAYFRYLFTDDDITDITAYRKRFVYVQQFSQTLNDLKRGMEVIEFEPNQLIHIRKLESAGVSAGMLQEFCDEVDDHVEEGTYFTVRSLREQGFDSEAFDWGFSDWFYANLLAFDGRFSFTTVFSTIVLFKGEQEITVKTFLADRMAEHGSIDAYDLMTELTDLYGCQVKGKYDVVYKTKSAGARYDPVLDRLYKDAEMYYREVEDAEEELWAQFRNDSIN